MLDEWTSRLLWLDPNDNELALRFHYDTLFINNIQTIRQRLGACPAPPGGVLGEYTSNNKKRRSVVLGQWPSNDKNDNRCPLTVRAEVRAIIAALFTVRAGARTVAQGVILALVVLEMALRAFSRTIRMTPGACPVRFPGIACPVRLGEVLGQ